MSKVNSFLSQRLKQASDKLSKMTGLAELSNAGGLSSFAGVFRVSALSEKEQEEIAGILSSHSNENQDIALDLQQILSLTSEVKAINNQAAILHGERIKKAQDIFKRYRDGAFSSWLVSTYGNRQTPYNFLQYFELYTALPQILHVKLEEMPRQAVYSLASRKGPFEKKEEIVKNYQGEPKQALLTLIRTAFPLDEKDKRASDSADQAIQMLHRLRTFFEQKSFRPSAQQNADLKKLIHSLQSLLEK